MFVRGGRETFYLLFSATLPALLSDMLQMAAFAGTSTGRSFVRSPSTTSRSSCRWTRRYRVNSTLSANMSPQKTALSSLPHRLVSGVLGVRSESGQRVSHGLHEGGSSAGADAAAGRGDETQTHQERNSILARCLIPCLSSQFLTFLFSKENSICEPRLSPVVPEEMKRPLSQYWISSSHNT